jgi:hypothetical protein
MWSPEPGFEANPLGFNFIGDGLKDILEPKTKFFKLLIVLLFF